MRKNILKMKKILLFAVATLLVVSCGQAPQSDVVVTDSTSVDTTAVCDTNAVCVDSTEHKKLDSLK